MITANFLRNPKADPLDLDVFLPQRFRAKEKVKPLEVSASTFVDTLTAAFCGKPPKA